MILTQEIIRRKRDGAELELEEIEALVSGITDGSVAAEQIAAFAMAVFFRGMSRAETVALTRSMTHSGHVLDCSDLGLQGPILDKHSTGGVGDKVSLMLAPMVAACGGVVPMISGRGLGHTGGTLDKLDSIPGYDTQPGIAAFKRAVSEVGCAIIGQTETLAPADRRFYAIRDVTATVESVPLITASILSKKLAAGLDALVMDVKTGSGAFAAELEQARELARSIVTTAEGAGMACTALISDQNQVLGRNVGNALEVTEAVDYLTGRRRESRLHELVLELGANMLVLGKLVADLEGGRSRLDAALESGEAAERFARMVSALGGPADLLERHSERLPGAPVTKPVVVSESGYVTRIDVRAVGLAVVALGGGRRRSDDTIDPAVGLSQVCGLGQELGPERPFALVHAADEAAAVGAVHAIRQAVTLGGEPPMLNDILAERVDGGTIAAKP